MLVSFDLQTYTRTVILGRAVALGFCPSALAGEHGRFLQLLQGWEVSPKLSVGEHLLASSCFLGSILQRSFLLQDAQEENIVMLLPLCRASAGLPEVSHQHAPAQPSLSPSGESMNFPVLWAQPPANEHPEFYLGKYEKLQRKVRD